MKVTLIGSLPPWKGLSTYAGAFLTALAEPADLNPQFLDFKSLYPARLHSAGDPWVCSSPAIVGSSAVGSGFL